MTTDFFDTRTPVGSDSTSAPISRRQILCGSVIGLGALTCVGNAWARASDFGQHSTDTVPTKLKTALHQENEIHASPQRIYEALLSSEQFAAITDAPAKINTTAGGSLSMFGGMVTGRNIELIPGKRIVQAWRPGSWDPGVYSIVKFELKASGANTTVILDHTGFPEGDFDSLSGGWISHYCKPMQKFFP